MPRKKKKDFETALTELEQIIEALEDGTLSLEETIKKYKQGMELAANCSELLGKAEQDIYLYENEKLKKIDGEE